MKWAAVRAISEAVMWLSALCLVLNTSMCCALTWRGGAEPPIFDGTGVFFLGLVMLSLAMRVRADIACDAPTHSHGPA